MIIGVTLSIAGAAFITLSILFSVWSVLQLGDYAKMTPLEQMGGTMAAAITFAAAALYFATGMIMLGLGSISWQIGSMRNAMARRGADEAKEDDEYEMRRAV